MLNDLHIANFRGFEDLNLQGLGRVNLIVGKNNTGKTSLLEAVTLLVTLKQPSDLRAAYRVYPKEETHFDHWLVRDGSEAGGAIIETNIDGKIRSCQVGLQYQSTSPIAYTKSSAGASPWSVHIQSAIANDGDLILPFAEAVRQRQGERTLEEMMRAVDPRIQTIRLTTGRNNQAFIEVDLGLTARMPISQAGAGLSRVLTILVKLLGAKPQFALLDEIENGIHHTAMPQVWKGIAEVAERMNVQIFATTHSHECLEAAHEAFAERSSYDFRVIQLYRVNQKADGRVLDRRLIEAALAGEIELR
jgi:predicted ATPase